MSEFDGTSPERIQSLERQVEQLARAVDMLSVREATARPPQIVVGKSDGDGITARSGDTPGSGEMELYHRNRTSGDLEASGTTLPVYNLGSGIEPYGWFHARLIDNERWVDPPGGVNPIGSIRFEALTWSGGAIGGLTTAFNTITAVGDTDESGDSGIAWNDTDKTFESANGGAYLVTARLEYNIPVTAWSAFGYCDPTVTINPQAMHTRYNQLIVVQYPSGDAATRDQILHLNTGNENNSGPYELNLSSPIDMGPGSANAVKLAVQSAGAGADGWDIVDAEIAFSRLGDIME